MSNQPRKAQTQLRLVALEDRLLPSGLSLVSNWQDGTEFYEGGWADDRGGRQIAYMNHYLDQHGLYILDVTDPADPHLISRFLPAVPSGVSFRDIETTQIGGRWIALLSGSSDPFADGIYVVDVTDPAQPKQIAVIHGNFHNLSVDGHLLFVGSVFASYISVYDISVPEHPSWIRAIASPAVQNVTVNSDRLYTANSFGSQIWDVSRIEEPWAPIQFLGQIPSGESTYHAWPTEDRKTVAIARGTSAGGELSLWDVSDPAKPVQTWATRLPKDETWSAYQVFIRGNLLYAAWFQAGVRVYDISDRYNPVLVGDYDTYPAPLDREQTTHGARGVYPFLGNDRILVFDTKSGMYTLELDLTPAPISIPMDDRTCDDRVEDAPSSQRRMAASPRTQVVCDGEENVKDLATAFVEVVRPTNRHAINTPELVSLKNAFLDEMSGT